MHGIIWLPLAGAAALATTTPHIVKVLRPRTAALALVGTAVTTAACWSYTLALMTLTAAGQLPAVASYGHWSPGTISATAPAPPVAGIAAFVVLIGTASATVRSLRHRGGALLAGERMVRQYRATPIVVLADAAPEAFAIGGLTGSTIAVSAGMLAALDDTERACLLAHEAAHVRGRHHFFRLIIGLAATINPTLYRFPALIENATERWADEQAAQRVGNRTAVATALAHAALAALSHQRSGPAGRPHAAFGATSVPERVRAMLQPAPRRRPAPQLALLALTILVITATVVASHDVEHLFEHARALQRLRPR